MSSSESGGGEDRDELECWRSSSASMDWEKAKSKL